MKKLFIVCTLAIGVIAGNAYASFPVKTTQNQELTVDQASSAVETLQEKQDVVVKSETKKADLKKEAKAKPDLDEWTITLLLCIFLGGLAAHRWYAKKPIGWNILFILTGGGCGIWWLVDLINILTKKF